jgi:ABC-type multidrug transport system ATPase subunit
MKDCPRCQAANAETDRFCRQCGWCLLGPGAQDQTDPTVLWRGQKTGQSSVLPGVLSLNALFADKSKVVIGRATDCDLCLPHATVSRYHALLERAGEGLRLRDLGSINGVWINGRRVNDRSGLQDGDRFGVGPFLLSLKDGAIHALDNSLSLRLEAHHLEKVVPLGGGQTRKILDDVNLVIYPGEFVSLLGPSGSGKSTLMDCLNGRRRATTGRVLANGEDFYLHFDNFRQLLGYVPQKDIVHTQLTVYRALYYTACLRLPPDTDPAERQARIEEVLREMELSPHRNTLVGNLSGGQIKRVSLGAELLAQPCLLYIDEATSGLDAGTETRMMRLFRQLSDEGRTIVCITHNVDNVSQCHLALILARGKLVYFGPPGEAPAYFRVSRISEIYDRLAEKDLAEWERTFLASSLHREFIAGRLAPASGKEEPTEVAPLLPPIRLSTLLEEGRKLVSLSEGPPLAERFREWQGRFRRLREWLSPVVDCWHQFGVLSLRYLELLWGDRRGLRLLLLQAPVVALFLLVGFIGKPFDQQVSALDLFLRPDGTLTPQAQDLLGDLHVQVKVAGQTLQLSGTELFDLYQQLRVKNPHFASLHGPVEVTFRGERISLREGEWKRIRQALARPDPRYTYMLLFILAMIVLWFGCNNAAKEIVKEEAIYGRERAVNLRILPYLGSKFLILSLMTALQVLVLMAILYGTLELLHRFSPGHSVPLAMHRLAYVPQLGILILLGMVGVALGLLLSACVSTPDRANALLPYVLIPQIILGGGLLDVHHGVLYQLAITLSPVYWGYRAIHLGASTLPAGFPGYVPYQEGMLLPCLALGGQMAVLLLATVVFLKRKEG